MRGFDENIRTADRGVSGSIELYTPQLAPGLRLLAFVDAASLSDAQLPAVDLVSGGLGLRYERGQVHLALDYAGILHDMLSMSKILGRKLDASTVIFRCIIQGAGRSKYYDFKLQVHPGDHGEPVITIMLPDED